MRRVLNRPEVRPLPSDKHFSVDGTLIDAWVSQKCIHPKDDRGDGRDFHGQHHNSNGTHASTTDSDCGLYRKAAGREAKLSCMGHATMENRNGMAVAGQVSKADGTAERQASEDILKEQRKRAGCRTSVGEDKAYDTRDHVSVLRGSGITPHVAQNDAPTRPGKHQRSAIDGRTTRHLDYRLSRSRRAMIKRIFGWEKQQGTMRRTKHRGLACVAGNFSLNLIAYDLVRLPKLLGT